MPLVTSENREEFIEKEMNKKSGKNPRKTNTHAYLQNDFSKMKDEDLEREILKHEGLSKKYLKDYFREHRGSIPLSEYKKDDPDYQDHIGKYMDLLIEQGYRNK